MFLWTGWWCCGWFCAADLNAVFSELSWFVFSTFAGLASSGESESNSFWCSLICSLSEGQTSSSTSGCKWKKMELSIVLAIGLLPSLAMEEEEKKSISCWRFLLSSAFQFCCCCSNEKLPWNWGDEKKSVKADCVSTCDSSAYSPQISSIISEPFWSFIADDETCR